MAEIAFSDKRDKLKARKNIIQLLDRFENTSIEDDQYDDYDSEYVESSLEERLKGINLDEAPVSEILSRLTTSESEEFQASLRRFFKDNSPAHPFSITNIVEQKEETEISTEGINWSDVENLLWKPWWLRPIPPRSLITELEDLSNKGSSDELENGEWESYAAIPKVSDKIVLLKEITRAQPSENIIFGLVDILFTYTLVCRHVNGDLGISNEKLNFDAIMGVCNCVWDVSIVLSSNDTFSPHSIEDVAVLLQNRIFDKPEYGVSSFASISSVLDDVSKILSSDSWVLSALSDLFHVFSSFVYLSKHDIVQKNKVHTATKKRGFSTERKLFYFLCLTSDATKHVRETGSGRFSIIGLLQKGVENERDRFRARAKELETGLEVAKKAMNELKHQPKIEGLDEEKNEAILIPGLSSKRKVFKNSLIQDISNEKL
ncbi:Zinc finger HIT domain-containing protein 2 [Nowakowskiella sp. JEL0078]|nr:Zinc finger HIT domain-containing protein 2 [Nowakowskiella sp. JEL0078]